MKVLDFSYNETIYISWRIISLDMLYWEFISILYKKADVLLAWACLGGKQKIPKQNVQNFQRLNHIFIYTCKFLRNIIEN